MTEFEDTMRNVFGDRLYKALHGRGHNARDMASMDAIQRFDEFCAWEFGDKNWGKVLRDVWESANFDE